nr:MAG TPA: Protein of unknown function (DUF1265) [Caudoviricetes sp.]
MTKIKRNVKKKGVPVLFQGVPSVGACNLLQIDNCYYLNSYHFADFCKKKRLYVDL